VEDQPTPTEEEDERMPEELPEHQAMQYPGHDDPELPAAAERDGHEDDP
jgi:hypothetical protein